MMTTWSAIPTLDRVFDEVLRSTFKGAVGTGAFPVAADVHEKSDAYTFQFDVPGVKAEDLEITLENRKLAIRGVRRFVGGENERAACSRPHGQFAMSYALPDSVEGENLTADLTDGVLTIRVPKPPKAQPRNIPIGRGSERNQIVG